jgi:hypothetical protein
VLNDEAARLANDSLRDFIAAMAAAGNPGSGRHEIGIHKIRGWILECDPAIGGSQVQAVIGIDGVIHARRAPRSQRTRSLTASEWVLREPHDADPRASAGAFADHLSRILAFDGVVRDDLDRE